MEAAHYNYGLLTVFAELHKVKFGAFAVLIQLGEHVIVLAAFSFSCLDSKQQHIFKLGNYTPKIQSGIEATTSLSPVSDHSFLSYISSLKE